LATLLLAVQSQDPDQDLSRVAPHLCGKTVKEGTDRKRPVLGDANNEFSLSFIVGTFCLAADHSFAVWGS
jgi:predicted proteasome-type protease